MRDTLNAKEMVKLRSVALGEEKADLAIINGDLVNVYSGELLKGQSVVVKGAWIAYVGPDPDPAIGPDTEVIDASGKVIIPGLIDGHTHMIWYCTPDEFIRYAARGGTTTFITETMELAGLGYEALLEYLQALEDQPVKIFVTIPPTITLSNSFRKAAPSLGELKKLLRRADVVGVGEAYWQEVLGGDRIFPALAAESLRLGKTVEGHAAGCRKRNLQAYVAGGVSSCHESVSAEEVLERVRLGVFVMIREGTVRKELEAVSVIKDHPIDYRRLSLVTDGITPRELVHKGYMECVVQRAIDLGFDAIKAIQMATLSPATYFRLDGFLGGLAPGKFADLVIIPDLQTIRAECVISSGQVIAREGKLEVQPRRSALSLKGPADIRVSPKDLAIHVQGEGPFKVRVIEKATMVVTREAIREMRPVEGELKADPEQDIVKASVISREGKIFNFFVKGLGIKRGALAASNSWEFTGIIVAGVDEEEMARAVNRVSELGGGIVLYADGRIQVELPLTVGGIMSNLSAEVMAQVIEELENKAKELGSPFDDILMALTTLTTPAIPFLRASEDGLVDLRKGKVFDLIIS
ncbi:MAG: adenine deaminase C-terminal domain-containing protein [Pseudomonadota bacterium]